MILESSQLGRYRLVRKIATGGMAELFLAKLQGAEGFEKEVVIKKILPQWSSDSDFVSMLIDEAKIAVQLSHPNIIQVYELGREGETYYIVMEYLHGVDLRRLVQKAAKGGLPIGLVVPAIVAAATVARLWAVLLAAILPATGAGVAARFGSGLPPRRVLLAMLLTLPGIAPLLWMQPVTMLASVAVAAVFLGWITRFLRARIGGSTGDCLGFSAYMGQLTVLLLAVSLA